MPEGISLFLFRDNFGMVFGILFEDTYRLSDGLYLCLSLDLHLHGFIAIIDITHWSLISFLFMIEEMQPTLYPKIADLPRRRCTSRTTCSDSGDFELD